MKKEHGIIAITIGIICVIFAFVMTVQLRTVKETVITLPVGNYTVTETKVPDGYSAEKTTYEFEIKKDETTEIVLKNTKLIDVPNTKLNMTYIYGIGISVVVVGIIFIVIANKSSNAKKKKN